MTVKLNIMHLLLFSKCIIWQHYLRHSPWECYISVIIHCFHQWPLKPLEERLASTFSLQYHPWIKCKGHDNSGNDRQFERLLIVKQILLVSTIGNGIQGNVKRTGYRIYLPQFSGYQVKILNLKHVIKHLISEKILTNNCCFEICKQKAFETWLLLFLVVNVTVIIGIFLYNCIGFILKMNLTIQKLHLNLKKEELFIRDNGHEVYLIFLLSMLFFLLCKKPKKNEKFTVSGNNLNF